MCIIAIVINGHEDFPVIICANRDEAIGRPSLPPEENSDIWCTRDLQSKGACIGLNSITGQFVGLTNIGRGGQKGYSRGDLVMHLLQDGPDNYQGMLNKRHLYPGMNLVLCDLMAETPQVQYTTNRDPDTKIDNPNGLHIINYSPVIVANDLVGDEFVKSPFLSESIKNVLSQTQKSSGYISEEQVTDLRDKLGSILLSTQSPPLIPWFQKLFYFSKKRRIQPALQTFVYSLIVLNFLFNILVGFSFINSFMGSIFMALLCAFYHHSKLNHLFTKIDVPFVAPWGTMSQTIIIKTKDRKVYYCYRDTVKKVDNKGVGWGEIGPWKVFSKEL